MAWFKTSEWGDDILILRAKAHRRVTRILVYAFLAAAGISSFMAPSQVVTTQSAGDMIGTIWTVLFTAAAVTCFLGSLLDRWVVEYVMLPLLYSSILVLAVIFTIQVPTNEAGVRLLPFAMLFYAFSFSLLVRWRDVQALLRATKELKEGEE
jgi:hypothetical protein